MICKIMNIFNGKSKEKEHVLPFPIYKRKLTNYILNLKKINSTRKIVLRKKKSNVKSEVLLKMKSILLLFYR